MSAEIKNINIKTVIKILTILDMEKYLLTRNSILFGTYNMFILDDATIEVTYDKCYIRVGGKAIALDSNEYEKIEIM